MAGSGPGKTAKAAVKVQEVRFAKAVDVGGQAREYIGTGPDWPDWYLFADYDTREIVVCSPQVGISRKRVRVPFENVVWYAAGMIASKQLLVEAGVRPAEPVE
jgi:hypothetical protein